MAEECTSRAYLVSEQGTSLLVAPGITWLGRASFSIPQEFLVNCSRRQASVNVEVKEGRQLSMSITCHGLNPLLFLRSQARERSSVKTSNAEASFFLRRGKTTMLFVGDRFYLAPKCLITVVDHIGESPLRCGARLSFNTQLTVHDVSMTPCANPSTFSTSGRKPCLKSLLADNVQVEKPDQISVLQSHEKRHIQSSWSSRTPAPILRHRPMKKMRKKQEPKTHRQDASICTEVKAVCVPNMDAAIPSSSNGLADVAPYQILNCSAQQQQQRKATISLLGVKRIRSVEENSGVSRKARLEEKTGVTRKKRLERRAGGILETSEGGNTCMASVKDIGVTRKIGTEKGIQTEGGPFISLTKKRQDPIAVMDQVTPPRLLSNFFASEEPMQVGANAGDSPESRKGRLLNFYHINVYDKQDRVHQNPLGAAFYGKASAKMSPELSSGQKQKEIGEVGTTVRLKIPLGGCACAICREEKLSETVGILSCDHFFCFTCIFEWSNKTVATTPACPLCKTSFDFITARTRGTGERVVLVGRGAMGVGEENWRRSENVTGCQGCNFGAVLEDRGGGPSGDVTDSPWFCFRCTEKRSRNQTANQWQALFSGQSSEARGSAQFQSGTRGFLTSGNNGPRDTATPLPGMHIEAVRPLSPEPELPLPIPVPDLHLFARELIPESPRDSLEAGEEGAPTLRMFARLRRMKERKPEEFVGQVGVKKQGAVKGISLLRLTR